MAKILVADDHQNTCITLEAILKREGHEVTTVQSGRAAIERIQHNAYDIVVTDLKLGDIDGIKLLSVIRELNPHAKVVLMTAFGTINSTVKAMKLGAYDYLTKPIQRNKILNVINKILSDTDVVVHKSIGWNERIENDKPPEIIGKNPSVLEAVKIMKEVSSIDVPVLILGESGTGKELIARSIHLLSARRKKSYVAINCATLPDNLQDSELFGHAKGAFTGAVEDKVGLFEQADGGTILLDEIGEMNLGTQAKLLRVLEDGEVRRVGGSGASHVDTRVLASTNEDLPNLIKANKFREDLFFRLNVIRISLPPLRQRINDLPLLIQSFIKKFAGLYQRNITGITPQASKMLAEYAWPGNVRELENTIKRAVILSKSEMIDISDLGQLFVRNEEDDSRHSIAELEKDLILRTLEETKWNNGKTAAKLGISPTTLWRKMKKFGLKNPNAS